MIPRGITYKLVPDKVEEEDYLILESVGPVRIPQRYLNKEGQIKMGSPYSERDLHGPTEVLTIDKDEDTEILVKDGPRWTQVTMAHHPFDVVGWDGYVYPFTFNAQDFEPITGTVHQPPPIHQTFEIRGYVVCTFAPRFLDTHPEAVKIPWVHDNVEADEVLFYVRGNFGSRRGIEPASITLHPRGIPHGPHPGTIMASKNATRTEELAVMFDTQHTLELTEQAVALDDEKYPQSWLDSQGRDFRRSRRISAPWTLPSGKLFQCGTEIPKSKLNCKRLNAASAKFRAVAPLASQAWSNPFLACSKPSVRTHSAKVCSERRAALRAHSNF